MITHRAIQNTYKTLGIKAAITRCKKAGLDLPTCLYWIFGSEAVRRYYAMPSI